MTNAELALLTLLAEAPSHGYDLEQRIEERGMREWTEIGFSSIYYLLKKLEGKGLVEGRASLAEAKGPARQVYHLTPTGASALRESALVVLSEPQPAHSAFMLGLANIPVLEPPEVTAALARYRAGLGESLARVRQRWDQERSAPAFVQGLFSRSVALLEAELLWLERFEADLHKEEPVMAPTLVEKTPYTAKKEPQILTVPEGWFLTYSGVGAPESEAFATAVNALFSLAYTVKFKLKATGQDFKVSPLEGLWWVEHPETWWEIPRSEWHWKVMIGMPPSVTPQLISEIRPEAATKKQNPAIEHVNFEPFTEGLVAQVLHLGSFATERPTIDRLHDFIHAQGYRPHGLHHEIYLSDFRRTAPEKLKTIIRQPIAQA